MGFTEAQVGRTERELVSYSHKSSILRVGNVQHVIPQGHSKKAQLVRALLQQGDITLASKFTRPVQ
jgi:hypothetical protein